MPKVTLYQKLRTTKTNVCAGKATAADLTAAANKYIDHAVTKNGKTKADAQAVVTRVRNAGCPVSGLTKKTQKSVGKISPTGKTLCTKGTRSTTLGRGACSFNCGKAKSGTQGRLNLR